MDDPNLDFILFSGVTLPEARPPDEATASMVEGRLDWLAQRMASSPIPVIPVGATCVNVSDYSRELLTAHGINLSQDEPATPSSTRSTRGGHRT